jgi:hypothetical protein
MAALTARIISKVTGYGLENHDSDPIKHSNFIFAATAYVASILGGALFLGLESESDN